MLGHLVYVFDGLLAGAIPLFYLVLLEEDLEADVFHCLRVQSLNFCDEVVLPLLHFMQKFDLIPLQLILRLAKHLTHGSHVLLFGQESIDEKLGV
mmetsp:Transcript_38990/g.51026  ORF Transcript_38990/g.51026 Transcript_38990/m.51026 type:complete len:95 (+) Transcript_38990:193-477(+)